MNTPKKLKITRKDPLTGKTNTMKIRVTEDQLDAWKHGMLIQDAMPQLSPDEREFIMSGITKNSWSEMVGGSEVPIRENDTDATQSIEDNLTNEMAPENEDCPEENFQYNDWREIEDAKRSREG